MTHTARPHHVPAIEADPDLMELTRLPAPVVYTAEIYADCIAWPEGYAVNGRREDPTEREYHLLRALAAALDSVRKTVGVRPPRIVVQLMRTPLDGRSTAPRPLRVLADTRRDEHGAVTITISRIRRR